MFPETDKTLDMMRGWDTEILSREFGKLWKRVDRLEKVVKELTKQVIPSNNDISIDGQ